MNGASEKYGILLSAWHIIKYKKQRRKIKEPKLIQRNNEWKCPKLDEKYQSTHLRRLINSKYNRFKMAE